MQRSIINQKPLAIFLYIVFFIIYESLSSVYLFMPPLFAVLFVLFANALKKDDGLGVFLIAFCLVIYEVEKGYLLFSTIIYFSLIYKFILPRLVQNFSCSSCIKVSYVLLSYIGFFIFSAVISNIFMQEMPSVNYYIIYYIVIEFFIVSIL